MADEKQLRTLKQGAAVWTDWRRQEGGITIDLRRANLSGADLGAADLNAADLRDATLIEADLSKSDLSAANLNGANLNGVNLGEANLNWAKLRGADLSEANLSAASLSAANLDYCTLRGANLSKANFRNAYLGGADLRGAKGVLEADFSDAIINQSTRQDPMADLRNAKDTTSIPDLRGAAAPAIQTSLERLSSADPKDVQGVAAAQLGVLDVYRREALWQSRLSFWVALGGSVAGLALFFVAVRMCRFSPALSSIRHLITVTGRCELAKLKF
jgi:uncharacterized protein YjbI with pentapeptide repeats